MFGIGAIIDNLHNAYPGEFKAARFSDLHEDFGLNGNMVSDALFIPADLSRNVLGTPVTQSTFKNLNLTKNYIGIFAFSRPIDMEPTIKSISNQLINTMGYNVVITRCEINSSHILDKIFSKSTADANYSVFALWFTISKFMINTKQVCPICYVDC